MRRQPTHNQNNFFIISLITFLLAAVFSVPTIGHCRKQTTTKVQILAINDFHGQITPGVKVSGRPVGSAPVLAAYLKDAAKGMEDRTFIVQAGDFVGASPPESALLQDEPAIMFLNQLANKYCHHAGSLNPKCNLVGTVGNHEFDEGQDELKRLIYGGNHENGPFLEDPWRGTKFPYVCANVVRERNNLPLMPPFVIKMAGNVPIAFVGALLKDTPSIVTASGIEGLKFIDEIKAINQQVEILKKIGVRTIIVLLHQGGTQTAYEGATNPEVTGLSGDVVEIINGLDSAVDVVITGHYHGFTNMLMENNKGEKILVTQSWSKGSAYADIDLEIDTKTRDVVGKTAQVVTTWADAGVGLQPDTAIATLVDEAKAATAPLTSKIVAQAANDMTRAQNPAGESALGNLIADAQRAKMSTDFAFMNPGGIRADLAAGDVTWGQLYSIQPFNNYLVRMTLTGQQIYDLLNQQFPPYQPYARMLQVSGLSYTWDSTLAAGDKIIEVRKTDGAPVELTAMYTVTVNSFIAEGGDKFTTLLLGTDEVIGPIDLDALIEYVQGLPQPFNAAIEGRIIRVN